MGWKYWMSGRWLSPRGEERTAKRAKSTSFRGNAEAIYSRISSTECAAAKLVRGSILRDLASAIDEMKSVPATTPAATCAALR